MLLKIDASAADALPDLQGEGMRGAVALLLAAEMRGGGAYPTRNRDIILALLKLANMLMEVGGGQDVWERKGS